MVTAVVSDLHLGSRMSVLATPATRERLFDELARADRVVLLGDALSLRERPVADVLAMAAPFLDGLRAAIGDRPLVIVPGNHDHGLVEAALERRRLDVGPDPLALEQRLELGDTGAAGALAQRLAGVDVQIAYPGLWLRPDVYATHGHYVDCHMTVPRAESLSAAAMARVLGPVPDVARPDDYEAVLAPLYAFAYARAQTPGGAGRAAGGVWRSAKDRGLSRLRGELDWRRPGALLLGAAAGAAALGALRLAGVGRFRGRISPEEIGRSGLRAAAEVVGRLGIEADHVIFGHTHHAGPLDGDRPRTTPGGTRLYNGGSWVYEPDVLTRCGPGDPFWPGRAVFVGDAGPPEVRLLLDEAA